MIGGCDVVADGLDEHGVGARQWQALGVSLSNFDYVTAI